MIISDYESHRDFLKDYFKKKREENTKYSLIFFSKLIDSSDSYLKLVLSGKRNLNLDKAKLLCQKIKFDSLETSYFITLVLGTIGISKVHSITTGKAALACLLPVIVVVAILFLMVASFFIMIGAMW